MRRPSQLAQATTRLADRLRSPLARHALTNSGARALALAGLAAATILVARAGGPADVGVYALLRMLPGLVGVLCVAGLPGAMSYFLAPARRDEPALWPSVLVIGALGGAVGALAWVALSPLLARTFSMGSVPVTASAAVAVVSQLYLTVGKTALQGLGDRRGGDAVIAAEELAFLPCYGAVLLAGLHGPLALVAGLVAADVLVGADAWRRVSAGVGRPLRSMFHGRAKRSQLSSMLSYGMRGQVGGMMTLLNLRLDFAVLGAVAGPSVLGAYAIASKYAELLRLPGTALTWVCYPAYAATSAERAASQARRLSRPTAIFGLVAAFPFVLLAGPVIGLLYGSRFADAVRPGQVLVAGMVIGGAAGVASGWLYARGRPGVNSAALGAGVVLTVVLDLLLIPHFGIMGAAVASTATYLLTDLTLVLLLWRYTAADLEPTVAVPAEAVT